MTARSGEDDAHATEAVPTPFAHSDCYQWLDGHGNWVMIDGGRKVYGDRPTLAPGDRYLNDPPSFNGYFHMTAWHEAGECADHEPHGTPWSGPSGDLNDLVIP